MAFKNQTFWHPTFFQSFEYQTSSVSISPRKHDYNLDQNMTKIRLHFEGMNGKWQTNFDYLSTDDRLMGDNISKFWSSNHGAF